MFEFISQYSGLSIAPKFHWLAFHGTLYDIHKIDPIFNKCFLTTQWGDFLSKVITAKCTLELKTNNFHWCLQWKRIKCMRVLLFLLY